MTPKKVQCQTIALLDTSLMCSIIEKPTLYTITFLTLSSQNPLLLFRITQQSYSIAFFSDMVMVYLIDEFKSTTRARVFALARSAVVWITRMRLNFIDKVGGARGTLFTERDNIH